MSDTARRWVVLAALAARALGMLINRLVGERFRAEASLAGTEVVSIFEYSGSVFVEFQPTTGALMYYGTGALNCRGRTRLRHLGSPPQQVTHPF